MRPAVPLEALTSKLQTETTKVKKVKISGIKLTTFFKLVRTLVWAHHLD